MTQQFRTIVIQAAIVLVAICGGLVFYFDIGHIGKLWWVLLVAVAALYGLAARQSKTAEDRKLFAPDASTIELARLGNVRQSIGLGLLGLGFVLPVALIRVWPKPDLDQAMIIIGGTAAIALVGGVLVFYGIFVHLILELRGKGRRGGSE